MPALQRRISLRGPRFWAEDGRVLFMNHLDGSTQIGPREATDEDRAEHAAAWAAFEAREPAEPFKPLVAFTEPPDRRKGRGR
jgi:hypothetical protein